MPKDARLGLVVGVALVIVIAATFYRNNGLAGGAPGSVGMPATSAAQPPAPGVPKVVRSHTVQEGETLISLAQHYYSDRSQAALLFRANRSQLRAPDQVPVGTVLIIPDLP
jgi:nucleoid-associated protein YgaU